MSTLRGQGLRYEVDGRAVVDDVSVEAAGGRLLAVNGPSGAGKSTLLTLLAGLIRPSAGHVLLDAGLVRAGDTAMRRRIGVVLQGYGLVTALTARENVAIPLQARGLPRAEIRERVERTLHDVGLAGVADHLVEDLSGGQQQRTAVARALAGTPEVVLADEPTAELDADNRERIVALFAAARSGTAVVLASHDPEVVERCDDVLHLDEGRVVAAP